MTATRAIAELPAEARAATATARASSLLADAQRHKAASRRHRRQAKAAMEQLTNLRRECDAIGVELIIEQQEA